MTTDIRTISVYGGRGKDGEREPVTMVEFRMGHVAGIVGPTGSGKTTLFNDIAMFADGSTPTRRRVLINGEAAPPEYTEDASTNPIAMISQGTKIFLNAPVGEFLKLHAEVRHPGEHEIFRLVQRTIAFANELTGEPISLHGKTTQLSGGQTRALLIADAAVIGNAPIVLLDEIENAGIDRSRALELLRQLGEKIFLFVTHDPIIALQCDFRIVMSGGMMTKIISTSDDERSLSQGPLHRYDAAMSALREEIRAGIPLSVGNFNRM